MFFCLLLKAAFITFVSLLAVGPIFLTTANISMTRGYKSGFCAILGSFTADLFYVPAGAFLANTLIRSIPRIIEIPVLFFVALFLLHISYGFWKTDLSKIKSEKVDSKRTNFGIYLKLLALTFSAPTTFITYAVIFSALANKNNSMLPMILGAFLGIFVFHITQVLTFGTIGRRINAKILGIINKASALVISMFAVLVFVRIIKSFV